MFFISIQNFVLCCTLIECTRIVNIWRSDYNMRHVSGLSINYYLNFKFNNPDNLHCL